MKTTALMIRGTLIAVAAYSCDLPIAKADSADPLAIALWDCDLRALRDMLDGASHDHPIRKLSPDGQKVIGNGVNVVVTLSPQGAWSYRPYGNQPELITVTTLNGDDYGVLLSVMRGSDFDTLSASCSFSPQAIASAFSQPDGPDAVARMMQTSSVLPKETVEKRVGRAMQTLSPETRHALLENRASGKLFEHALATAHQEDREAIAKIVAPTGTPTEDPVANNRALAVSLRPQDCRIVDRVALTRDNHPITVFTLVTPDGHKAYLAQTNTALPTASEPSMPDMAYLPNGDGKTKFEIHVPLAGKLHKLTQDDIVREQAIAEDRRTRGPG